MIKGEKVGLRAVEPADLQLLQGWRNIASFRRNFREIRELNSVNQEQWFNRLNQSANDFMFTIVRHSNDQHIDHCDNNSYEPIGACGLLYVNWIIRSADFSFYIGHEEQYIDNYGYADEAVRLLLRYGFDNLNLHKIWMELYEFDSVKLDFFVNRFGFQVDGILRDNCFEDGRYWNSNMISLLSDDYRKAIETNQQFHDNNK